MLFVILLLAFSLERGCREGGMVQNTDIRKIKTVLTYSSWRWSNMLIEEVSEVRFIQYNIVLTCKRDHYMNFKQHQMWVITWTPMFSKHLITVHCTVMKLWNLKFISINTNEWHVMYNASHHYMLIIWKSNYYFMSLITILLSTKFECYVTIVSTILYTLLIYLKQVLSD